MLPKLALIICILFVLFLLRIERKQAPDVTRASWIATIWMLYIAGKPLGVWFPSSFANPEAGSPLDRTFLIIVMCVALYVLIRRGFDWSNAVKENAWLVVLLIFMLVSVIWSTMPNTSFNRWVRELQAVLMAFFVLSEPSPRQTMESILRRTTYILIPFSILLIKYFPAYGVEYGRWSGIQMWIGVTVHKNSLGRLCCIAIFFLIWSLVKRWRGHETPVWKYQTPIDVFILVMALWLLRGPGGNLFTSATSAYALGMALLVFLGLSIFNKYRIRIKAGALMIATAVIIFYGIITVLVSGSSAGFLASSAGRDASLTGRTDIWAAILPVAMRHPLIGSGFGGFWTYKVREYYQISEAHNGYLEVFIGLGFVGVLLVSIFLLSCCKKAYRELTNNFSWGTLFTCFIIMVLVHNIAESSIDSLANHLTAVLLFFSVSSSNVFSGRLEY